jgi:stearoyl-CoA desaturase (delta-9 desaturase)
MATAELELIASRQVSRDQVNWLTTTIMAIFHAGAIAALFFFSWKALALVAVLWYISGSLGIGMGYHRLLTHRGYKVPRWVEYFLTTCAVLALEGGPIFWVATHRVHHQFSDQEGDPHSPRDGKWWSHMGWILMGETLHHNTAALSRYAPDLCKDRFHVWISKWHWVPTVIVGLAILAIGGWKYVLWGIFFRVVLGLHSTWLVNSATHLWGSRRFATKDDSVNNWFIAIFMTFGEGWHNNHHANPTSARHGLAWYEIDINWIGISALRMLGLAKTIHVAQLPAKGEYPASAKVEMLSA